MHNAIRIIIEGLKLNTFVSIRVGSAVDMYSPKSKKESDLSVKNTVFKGYWFLKQSNMSRSEKMDCLIKHLSNQLTDNNKIENYENEIEKLHSYFSQIEIKEDNKELPCTNDLFNKLSKQF